MFNQPSPGLFILDFKEIVTKAKVLKVGTSFIEIPNRVVFTKGKVSMFHQFLNPGIQVIPVSSEDFDKMLELISTHCSSLGISGENLPKSKVYINFSKMVEDLFIIEVSKNTIKLNNLYFTTSTNEYHGSSIAGFEVYLVTEDEFSTIQGFVSIHTSL